MLYFGLFLGGVEAVPLLSADIKYVDDVDLFLIFVDMEIYEVISHLHAPDARFFKEILRQYGVSLGHEVETAYCFQYCLDGIISCVWGFQLIRNIIGYAGY